MLYQYIKLLICYFLRKALEHNFNSIIIVHNNSSNDLNPFDDDLENSKKMVDAGKLIKY